MAAVDCHIKLNTIRHELAFRRRFATKDTALVVLVMELGAQDAPSASGPYKDFGGQEHSEKRRGKINP
jgi:hypothetical protein